MLVLSGDFDPPLSSELGLRLTGWMPSESSSRRRRRLALAVSSAAGAGRGVREGAAVADTRGRGGASGGLRAGFGVGLSAGRRSGCGPFVWN